MAGHLQEVAEVRTPISTRQKGRTHPQKLSFDLSRYTMAHEYAVTHEYTMAHEHLHVSLCVCTCTQINMICKEEKIKP